MLIMILIGILLILAIYWSAYQRGKNSGVKSTYDDMCKPYETTRLKLKRSNGMVYEITTKFKTQEINIGPEPYHNNIYI